MPRRVTQNVSLSPELQRLIAEKVATGRYQSASEVVRAGLRLLEAEAGQAEAIPQQAPEGFRLATEVFQGGVSDHDLVTGHVERTPRYLEIIGEKPRGLPSSAQEWFVRIHPDDLPTYMEARRKLLMGEAAHAEAEYRVRHRDGHWVWVWHRAMMMRDGAGQPRRIVSSVVNVSNRKQAEQALRESEARFRHMADSAPALIWMTDDQGRVVFANMHFDHVFGRPAVQMLGDGWRQVVHREDVRTFRDAFRAAFQARWPFRVEVRVTDKQGETRWLRCDGVPRLNDAGAFLGYTGCAVDITEAKTAAESLRESEERYRLALDAGRLGTWELDLTTGARLLSARSAEIFGMSAESLCTLDAFRAVVHPEDREKVETAFQAMIEHDMPYQAEFRVRSADGGVRWVASQAVVKRDVSGRPQRVIGIHLDVTARKRIEEHQQLLINELNHRVKNTLATVQSIAAQSLRHALTPAEAREAFESRLMALSRAHDVLTRENWEGAELREVVWEAVAPYRHQRESRLHLRGPAVRLPPRMALALAMALQELATNAVKYGALSNEAGEVRIAWRIERSNAPRRLRLRWAEAGGPPVMVPNRRGFGSRLIERSLAKDLNAEVRIDFHRSGVVCTIDAPEPNS